MKTILYWFSGTGNSLALARILAHHLDGCEVAPVADAARGDTEPADVTGLVFPVYWLGAPLLVREFAERVPLGRHAYLFTVATYGDVVGRAHTELARLFRKRGVPLAAGWSVRMPANYTPMHAPPPEEQQRTLLKAGRQRMSDIARAVRRQETVRFEDSAWPLRVSAIAVHAFWKRRVPRFGREFDVAEQCTGCGTCERVCPVCNIELVEGRPMWHRSCQSCLACLQWYPVEAIQHGTQTVDKARYHHPELAATDLFRRLD